MNANQPAALRVVTFYINTEEGQRIGPETATIHVSRHCTNCDAFVPDGIEVTGLSRSEWPKCLNLCSAAEDPDDDQRWCVDHQTAAEFRAGIHCPERPILALVAAV